MVPCLRYTMDQWSQEGSSYEVLTCKSKYTHQILKESQSCHIWHTSWLEFLPLSKYKRKLVKLNAISHLIK